jgi:hypothetical protein
LFTTSAVSDGAALPVAAGEERVEMFGRRGSDAEPLLAGGGVRLGAWGQQVLSARGFKRVGSRSEYAI